MVKFVSDSWFYRNSSHARLWTILLILGLICKDCVSQTSVERISDSADFHILNERLKVYGLNYEDIVLSSTNSTGTYGTPESGTHDSRFDLGERLIQMALHEEEDPTKVERMRARILELLQHPTRKESDPAVDSESNATT